MENLSLKRVTDKHTEAPQWPPRECASCGLFLQPGFRHIQAVFTATSLTFPRQSSRSAHSDPHLSTGLNPAEPKQNQPPQEEDCGATCCLAVWKPHRLLLGGQDTEWGGVGWGGGAVIRMEALIGPKHDQHICVFVCYPQEPLGFF